MALGTNQPPIQWVLGALSPGAKRPGHEASIWCQGHAKVMKDGAIPPLPHISS
jgi:hypothetical protein